jgi:hypothetical protein
MSLNWYSLFLSLLVCISLYIYTYLLTAERLFACNTYAHLQAHEAECRENDLQRIAELEASAENLQTKLQSAEEKYMSKIGLSSRL